VPRAIQSTTAPRSGAQLGVPEPVDVVELVDDGVVDVVVVGAQM
jgi:hypothetical protein